MPIKWYNVILNLDSKYHHNVYTYSGLTPRSIKAAFKSRTLTLFAIFPTLSINSSPLEDLE